MAAVLTFHHVLIFNKENLNMSVAYKMLIPI